jgi:hypothetical protein
VSAHGRAVSSSGPLPRRGRWLARLALSGGVAAAGLVAAEIALRLQVPQWAVVCPPTNYRPDLFESAPFGYRLKGGGPREYPYPRENPRRVTVHSTPEGFRGARPILEPDPRPRILVLGDSMVFGQGVEEPERLTEVMEAEHPEWRVDNMGMVGFGTDLMLRSLEEVGLAAKPDAVVVAIYTDDLRRVAPPYAGMGFPLPKYRLRDGELESVPYPEPRWWERLRLYQGLRYASLRYVGSAFALNAAILDRFAALSRERGFALVVAYLPSPDDRWDDRMRRDFLGAWCASSGIAFLDLSEAMARAGREAAYIPEDTHWSPEGHAVAGREVAGALRGVLRAGSGEAGMRR